MRQQRPFTAETRFALTPGGRVLLADRRQPRAEHPGLRIVELEARLAAERRYSADLEEMVAEFERRLMAAGVA